MGKYSPGYYNVGFDPVVTNAEGQAVKMTTRGENGEYLEIVVKEKYNDLGERTVEAVGGIKT